MRMLNVLSRVCTGLLTLALLASPMAAQSGSSSKSEEQRAKEREQQVMEMQKKLAEAQRTMAEQQRRVVEEQRRAMEAAAREMERQMLIHPWSVPWEVDKEFDKVKILFDMAGAQHEIVMMLIEEKKFDEAAQETTKIMRLGFPERYDLFILNEVDEVADQLIKFAKDDLAIQVLEAGKSAIRHPEAKAGLLMEVARIHRKNNKRDLAIKACREAIALQQQVLENKAAAKPAPADPK